MLRLSSKAVSIAAAMLLVSTSSFAQQGGTAGKIADATKQLQSDVQACKPINLGEYQALLNEAAKNKQRATKAANKGVPVDMKQVDADLAAASALFNQATAALVQQCMRTAQAAQPQQGAMNLSPFARDILVAHNTERAEFGAAPLHWSPALEASATAYAQQLARTGQLAHASREGRGTERENLSQGRLGSGPIQMMRNWIKEKRNFKPGKYPEVSATGDWLDVSHYTQMIWPQTTDIGCGVAEGAGYAWMVCRYNPGGNKDGKPVGFTTVTNAAAPALPPMQAQTNDDVATKGDSHGLTGEFDQCIETGIPANSLLLGFGCIYDGLDNVDLGLIRTPFNLVPGLNRSAAPTGDGLECIYNVNLTGGLAHMFADLFLFTDAVNYNTALNMLSGSNYVNYLNPFSLSGSAAELLDSPGAAPTPTEGHVMAVQFYDRSRFHLETTHIDKNTGGGILVDTLGGLYECPAESSPAPEIDTKVEQPALAPVAPPPPPPTEPLVPM